MRYLFGEWQSADKPLTVDDIVAISRKAEAARADVASYPMDQVLELLGELKATWSDPQYAPRKELLELLPAATGFSREMIELSLAELSVVFDPDHLRKKLSTEMRGIPPFGDATGSGETRLEWQPLGVLLHVLSGNVFLVAAGSLVEGMITRNVNILKMASSERIFLPRLIQSMIECETRLRGRATLSKALAVVDFSSSQKDVIAEIKRRVDGVIVWGGEEAVKAYRAELPARTRLVVFGPKLSFGLITSGGASPDRLAELARNVALEVSIWDQNACTAPQAIYVQGETNARALVEALAPELARMARELPAGSVGPDTAVEIQKMRSVAEIAEARGLGMLRASEGNVDWTVILDRGLALDPSPLHRTIRVVPFEDLAAVIEELAPLRGYLQTAGLSAAEAEYPELSSRLTRAGVVRIVPLGQMSGGEIDDPHDGAYDLPQLMQLAFRRHPRSQALSRDEARARIDARLRELITQARKSPFYRERLAGLRIETVAELEKIPVLTRQEMEAGMPPQGMGLSTGSGYEGGYVSRSGGSTGAPKFSIYDGRDWEAMISNAVPVFRALGLERGDRLANCMLAGDLYGSFVSFDHINARMGVTTFAFAGSVKPDTFVDTWRKFRINAVQGIPSTLIGLLRAAKRLEPALTIDKVIYAGSPLAPSDAEWLRSELGVRRISSVIGANDGGQIAFQCQSMSGRTHHTIDDFNYLELVDEQGRSVPDGEPGRIVITSLVKFAFPLIRYEVGDQARIVPSACGCPAAAGTRTIEFLGRADDMLPVGVLNVKYADFETALSGLPISVLQLAARNDVAGETLAVRAESERHGPALAAEIREAILKAMPSVAARLADGGLAGMDIHALAPGSLPRNERSGKVKGVIDERQ